MRKQGWSLRDSADSADSASDLHLKEKDKGEVTEKL